MSIEDAPREMRAAVLAMRQATNEITAWVDSAFSQTFDGPWRAGVESAVRTPQQRILTLGTTVQGTGVGGSPGFLMGAASSSTFGRALTPIENWAGFEYGVVHPAKPSTYVRRAPRTGTPHRVTRNVKSGHPSRVKKGYVYHTAIARLLPRMASFWTQSVIRAFMDAAEKGR